MRLKFFKSPICWIAALVIVLVGILEVSQAGVFQHLEWMTYDWRVRLAHVYDLHPSVVATNLGVIEINDNTIGAVKSGEFGFQFGLYWPRQVYGRALAELSRQGAKAVAFDVIFAETRSDHPPVTNAEGSVISSDEYFARQLKESGNAILAASQGVMPDSMFRTNAWRVGDITADRDGDGILRRDRAVVDYRDWHPVIKLIADRYNCDLSKTEVRSNEIALRLRSGGETTLPLDTNGMLDALTIFTSIPPGVPAHFPPFKNVRVWNMGILIAAYELKLDVDHAKIDLPHHQIVLHGEHGLTRSIPVDSNGYFYIDWSIGLNDTNLTEGSFDQLLASQADAAAGRPTKDTWRGKLVVLGSTATGNDLTDTGSTSLETFTYLMSKHWNVANSVITGRFIRTTPMPLNLLLIFVVGAFSAWITWKTSRPVTGSFLMALAAVVYVAISVLLFLKWRIWLPVILPLLCAGVVTHVSALTYRVTVEQHERKRIKSLFARFLSPEVFNKVMDAKDISLESLSGERRETTVLFADIRGFTELTDAAQAENTEFVRLHALSAEKADDYFDEQAKEVMRTVTLYLGIIAECVKKHHGTFDKYIGDCVMAFWGAPLANPQHAVGAVRCAVEAQQALHALNLRREEENKQRERENFERLRTGEPLLSRLPVLSMGTGINTGMTIAGLMGSEAHIVNYTVFGREVNLASRLEGISGHGRIIIGELTQLALQRDDPELAKLCFEMPPKAVKGFRERVRMFEVRWQPAAPSAKDPSEPGQTRDNAPAAV